MKKKIVFNKLVRDRIPEIIKASGDDCITRIAEKKEYESLLNQKLREEVEELIANPCAEEVADVLEVIETISKFHSMSLEEIKVLKIDKKKKRGGFARRVVLETTSNNHNLKVVREGSHVHLDLGDNKPLDKDFLTSGEGLKK